MAIAQAQTGGDKTAPVPGAGADAAAAAGGHGAGRHARALKSRLLQRGESAVASVGIALAASLLLVMAGSAYWAVRTERAARAEARAGQVKAAGEVLSQSVETLVAREELTSARRLVAEAARWHELIDCRVVLSDGRVLAAVNPKQIDVPALPESWSGRRLPDDGPAAAAPPPPGGVTLSFPLSFPGRGEAELVLSADLWGPRWGSWQTQAGVGAIAAAGMMLLLAIYRRLKARLRAISAVREALLAIGGGEAAGPALAVSGDLGAEARAWNEVIGEREKLRKQDVAERAREALGRRGQGKGDLSNACDAMSQGLLLIDENSRVCYANGAAAVFLRTNRDDVLGAEVGKFVQVDTVAQAIRDVATGAVRRRVTMDVEQRDDNAPRGGEPGENGEGEARGGVLRFSVRPVRREDNAAAMVTIEDITQQKVAERARHAFVAQATHELRTPLTNIRLYVETAIEEGEQNPVTRAKCLNVINGEARRLERIVGEMLSVAEIEAGSFSIKRDEVRLETLFEDLRADFSAQAADKQIDLAFNLPPKLPAIKGDRDKVLLALHNLVGNAMKYTPDGGRVEVNVQLDSRQMVVEVRDTGIGISAEDAEKIFDRFYRAKDPRVAKITGTGLGLTLAREVVRLHGGDVTVESQLNKGSTFTLTLPVSAEAA